MKFLYDAAQMRKAAMYLVECGRHTEPVLAIQHIKELIKEYRDDMEWTGGGGILLTFSRCAENEVFVNVWVDPDPSPSKDWLFDGEMVVE